VHEFGAEKLDWQPASQFAELHTVAFIRGAACGLDKSEQ
jgi:hypothetical protein